jgi:hypothetical protein
MVAEPYIYICMLCHCAFSFLIAIPERLCKLFLIVLVICILYVISRMKTKETIYLTVVNLQFIKVNRMLVYLVDVTDIPPLPPVQQASQRLETGTSCNCSIANLCVASSYFSPVPELFDDGRFTVWSVCQRKWKGQLLLRHQ